MTDESSRLERFLEQTARKVSGGGLHPIELLQRVEEAVEHGVDDGVAPNDITIAMSEADFGRYQPAITELRTEIRRRLETVERERGLRRLGERRVRFELSTSVADGAPVVRARFADTEHAPVIAPGVTQRIVPERNLVLVLSDGRRVRVSHTPFNIGRGKENDLVIPSMDVSRRHAQLTNGTGGPVLRDAGSRNGLVVEGARFSEVALRPGVRVHMGDAWIALEVIGGGR